MKRAKNLFANVSRNNASLSVSRASLICRGAQVNLGALHDLAYIAVGAENLVLDCRCLDAGLVELSLEPRS